MRRVVGTAVDQGVAAARFVGGTCPCALDHAREKATRFTCRRPGALSPGARVDSTVGMAPCDAPLPDPLPARLAPCPPVHPSDLANVLLLVPPCWRRAGAPSRRHCAFSGGELHPDFPSTTGFWGGRSGRPAPWPDACSVCSSPPSSPPKRTSSSVSTIPSGEDGGRRSTPAASIAILSDPPTAVRRKLRRRPTPNLAASISYASLRPSYLAQNDHSSQPRQIMPSRPPHRDPSLPLFLFGG